MILQLLLRLNLTIQCCFFLLWYKCFLFFIIFLCLQIGQFFKHLHPMQVVRRYSWLLFILWNIVKNLIFLLLWVMYINCDGFVFIYRKNFFACHLNNSFKKIIWKCCIFSICLCCWNILKVTIVIGKIFIGLIYFQIIFICNVFCS